MECMQRGIQHLNVFELGQPGFDFPDITSFIDDIDTEVDRVGTQSLPVRGKGPDTILCLDTSSSMCGENFNKMITAVHKLIDGIEELANYEEVQENIAVTTFGSYSRVVTHLTNDYTHVKNEIDFLTASGPSSLHRGLSMSLAACIANYAEVSVNDVRLMARVIVITDGMFSTQHGVSDDEFDPMNTIMVPLAAKLFKMNGFVCYCVQIGSSEDTEMLQLLTKTTNGKLFPYEQMGDLAILSKHLFAATRLLRQSPALVDGDEETRENGEATLQALLDLESSSRGAFGREFSDSEKETIIELAMDISKRPSTRIAEPNEYPVQELSLQLPPLGTRVRRGPDWVPTYNQDSHGPGTVVNHNNNGTVDVLWDCGVMPCTYHCYDPCQVLTTDRDERQVRAGELIQVGCKVTRGTGWNSGDDDGGPDAWGVVCMCTRKGTVTVRWQSRKIGKYKYGDEVELMDTSVGQAQATGFDVNTGPEFETDSKPTSGIKKKRLLSIVYDTGTRDSNAQFLKSTTFNYHVKSGILDYAPDNHPKPVRCRPFQKPPGIEIPVVWSYQEEAQDKWIEFSADNARKLETDWLNKRKSSLVSILDKGEGRTGEPTHGRIESRVVFAKMTMSSISVGERKSQLTLKVKREEKLNQERRNEQQMSEAGTDKP
ncbi:uncharacterized protein LOC117334089 [Pecten maximus]|uniref:uncharacterized protein LOC117334089 n=1 Tax=Pecten maximus TaxID=6579 RepID=UPI001457E805|nr:uncharacterized protein LOC117334089 [Pecten maximus]XP_033749425.1 uncharacterized protein LOC117334089 [Pecten maximus]